MIKLSLKQSPLYLAISITMLVTFFVCRILLMPAVIHLYCAQLGVGYLNAVLGLPLKCKLGTSSFYALNLYWFSLMIRGAVRVYQKRKSSAAAAVNKTD
jgi:vancomycin permeability regulator SanA